MLDDSADFPQKFVVADIASEKVRVGAVQVVGGEAVKQVRQVALAQDLAFDGAVARVVGQLDGIYRVDIEVQKLRRRKSGHGSLEKTFAKIT